MHLESAYGELRGRTGRSSWRPGGRRPPTRREQQCAGECGAGRPDRHARGSTREPVTPATTPALRLSRRSRSPSEGAARTRADHAPACPGGSRGLLEHVLVLGGLGQARRRRPAAGSRQAPRHRPALRHRQARRHRPASERSAAWPASILVRQMPGFGDVPLDVELRGLLQLLVGLLITEARAAGDGGSAAKRGRLGGWSNCTRRRRF